MTSIEQLFPRAARYDRAWTEANSLGDNVLFQAESLCEALPLTRGMRVLDLACGHAASSIFLAREFGVTVFAVDRAVDPSANLRRIVEMRCEDRVFPIRADARSLPFPHDYFDAIVMLEALVYVGTDERLLLFLSRFLKERGRIGAVDVCFTREIATPDDLSPDLRHAWRQGWNGVHTAAWWRRHWENTGLVRVTCCEHLPGSEALNADYVRRFGGRPYQDDYVPMIVAENGDLVRSFRIVGERTDYRLQVENDGTLGEY